MAATVCALAGCGGKASSTTPGHGSPVPSERGATDEGCIEGALGASMVHGLDLEETVQALSFVALDHEHYLDLVVEQVGDACPEVDSGTSCLLEIPERQPGFYLANGATPYSLIATRDGEHDALTYWTLRELLGPINTPNEAAVVAWSEGWQVDCEQIVPTGDGFEFTDTVDCAEDGQPVRVSRDGAISHSAHCLTGE